MVGGQYEVSSGRVHPGAEAVHLISELHHDPSFAGSQSRTKAAYNDAPIGSNASLKS